MATLISSTDNLKKIANTRQGPGPESDHQKRGYLPGVHEKRRDKARKAAMKKRLAAKKLLDAKRK